MGMKGAIVVLLLSLLLVFYKTNFNSKDHKTIFLNASYDYIISKYRAVIFVFTFRSPDYTIRRNSSLYS